MLLKRNMLNIDRRATALTLGTGLAFNLALLMVCYGFVLLIIFPFLFQAVPWVTTLPHFLASVLVLLVARLISFST